MFSNDKKHSPTLLILVLIILFLLLSITIVNGNPSEPLIKRGLKNRIEVGEPTIIKITVINTLNETIWIDYIEDTSELYNADTVGFKGITNILKWSGKLEPDQSFYGEYKAIPFSKGKFNLTGTLSFCKMSTNTCNTIITRDDILVIKSPIIGNILTSDNILSELSKPNHLILLGVLFFFVVFKRFFIRNKKKSVEISNFLLPIILTFILGFVAMLFINPVFIMDYIIIFSIILLLIYIFL